MLSTTVYVVFFCLYSLEVFPIEVGVAYYLAADTFCNICSCITQAMVCYILWNIDEIEPEVIRGNSEHDQVSVVEVDEHFDLQLRLWR